MLTRRQFFGQMKKLGFSKSRLQLTRIGLTYDKEIEGERVSVTVPKYHEGTFTILGNVPYSGIFVENNGKQLSWGTPVIPSELGVGNMLEVCLGLCKEEIMFNGATVPE